MFTSSFLLVFTGFLWFFNIGMVYWNTLSVLLMRIGALF